MLTPTITWSNGKVDRAPSWQALMDKVRKTQIVSMDEHQFRLEMAKRALRWSRTEIDPWAPPHEFFRELARALMIVIGEGWD